MCIWINFSIFVPLKPYTMEENKDLNRIKVMLAENHIRWKKTKI